MNIQSLTVGRIDTLLYMKKESAAIWVMCGVSLVMSIIAICVAGHHTPNLGIDYQGMIVGVLSLLVTVLIGWNIYSVLDLKGLKDRIYVTEKTLKKDMNKAINNASLNFKIEMMESSAVLQAYHSKDLIEALQVMFHEYHRVVNNDSIAKIMAHSYIVSILSNFTSNGKDAVLADNLIKDLSQHVSYEEVDCFLHDFLSLPDERKYPQHDELSLLLQRLIFAKLQDCYGQKAK